MVGKLMNKNSFANQPVNLPRLPPPRWVADEATSHKYTALFLY
jgi:hypothetical protein